MIPYDVQLLVGNVAGCSDVTTSQPFFTREGGIYIDDLQSVCCDYLLHLYYIPAPISPPHNVMVERLPNGTAMNVSFTRLSIVEARSINITYTVFYSLTTFSKREEPMMIVVPDKEQYIIIGGLDPSETYHVQVRASNSNGDKSSPVQSVEPGIIIRHVKCNI